MVSLLVCTCLYITHADTCFFFSALLICISSHPSPLFHPFAHPRLSFPNSCTDYTKNVPVQVGNVYASCPGATEGGVGALTLSFLKTKAKRSLLKKLGVVQLVVQVDNTAKTTKYKGLSMTIDLPPGARLTRSTVFPLRADRAPKLGQERSRHKKSGRAVDVQPSAGNGTTVSWRYFKVRRGGKVYFEIKAKIDPSTPADRPLPFQATLAQTIQGVTICPTSLTHTFYLNQTEKLRERLFDGKGGKAWRG